VRIGLTYDLRTGYLPAGYSEDEMRHLIPGGSLLDAHSRRVLDRYL